MVNRDSGSSESKMNIRASRNGCFCGGKLYPTFFILLHKLVPNMKIYLNLCVFFEKKNTIKECLDESFVTNSIKSLCLVINPVSSLFVH